MFLFFVLYFNIFLYAISPLVIPFKTYNPLITRNKTLLELIKVTNDTELVKNLLINLIYVTLDFGAIKPNKDNSLQKIDFFLNMNNNDFYFNIYKKINVNQSHVSDYYPDLKFNDFTLLKKIINLRYYNNSLKKLPLNLFYPEETKNIANETINFNLKNNIKEKVEKIQATIYIKCKDSAFFDHRPGVLGLYINNFFISNIKDKIPIRSKDWMIKYKDNLNEEGDLIIGGLSHEYDEEHFSEQNLRNAKIYIENNMHPTWRIKFIKSFISFNEKNKLNEYILKGNQISSFSIDEFFILGTDEYFYLIQEHFFNYYMKNNVCKIQIHKKTKYGKNYNHFMCYFNGDINKRNKFLNNFPTIKFYQSEMNYNFTLNSTDLFTIIPDNNRVLFNIEFLKDYNNWVFGKPFFKKYQLIFDDDSKLIKFYVENRRINYSIYNQGIKYFSYVIIVVLLVIILFILRLYRNKKILFQFKKDDIDYELSDYFDYNISDK